MIVNVLRFRFRNGTTKEQQARVIELMRQTAAVDSVTFSTVGRDLGDPEDGYTHAYCAGVEDLTALRGYLFDPVHVSNDFELVPYIEGLWSTRISDDLDDSELNEKIMALHLEKLARYPALVTLFESIPDNKIPTSA